MSTENPRERAGWTRPFAELPLAFQIKLIHDRFTARLNMRLRECDLTFSQNHILMYLARNQDRKVYQKELCESVVDEENRRYRVIRLTERGQSFLIKSRQDHDYANEVLVRGFTEEDKKLLAGLLDRVYRNMIEAGMPGPGDPKDP